MHLIPTPKINQKLDTFFNNAILIICKTSIYWQNLPTHTSLYLPMHLQIMDFNYKKYNVKCGYYNCEVFFGGNPLLPLWTI